MMVRDATPATTSSIEVLLVRRNPRASFAGGAHVFPGGALDPDDAGPAAEAFCAGRSDAGASLILGVPAGGLAYWVGAVRESFEEAGVLLAYGPDGALLSFSDAATKERFAARRRSVNEGREQFLAACQDEEVTLATDRVHYFAHWITPEGAPRRFDTRFFVAAAPPDQTPAHDASETVADVWMAPEEALSKHRAGEIDLILPTIRNLQALARFTTTDDLLAAARSAASVPVTVPRVVVDGRGVRVVLPGDEDYEEVWAEPADDPANLDSAVRAASRAVNRDPRDEPPLEQGSQW